MNNMKKCGIYFGGGGGYFTYYLGIACYLQENYDLSNITFGGVSAGSIISCIWHVSGNNNACVNVLDIIKNACCELSKTNTMNPLILNEPLIGKNASKLLKKTITYVVKNTNSFGKYNINALYW